MSKFEVQLDWAKKLAEGRECGPCYACCVWLGISDLKKYTGQACRHLNGGDNPACRCSIYSKRPPACSEYICLWRAGWGPTDLRPYESGILITIYPSERDPGYISATVNVFDTKKAAPHINQMIGELLMVPMLREARLIFLKSKKAIMFREGKAYRCRLLPPEGYESLMFEAIDEPMGTYQIKELSDE